MSGSVAYGIYNSFEVGVPVGKALSPMRRALDLFLDPAFAQGFMSAFFQVWNSFTGSGQGYHGGHWGQGRHAMCVFLRTHKPTPASPQSSIPERVDPSATYAPHRGRAAFPV